MVLAYVIMVDIDMAQICIAPSTQANVAMTLSLWPRYVQSERYGHQSDGLCSYGQFLVTVYMIKAYMVMTSTGLAQYRYCVHVMAYIYGLCNYSPYTYSLLGYGLWSWPIQLWHTQLLPCSYDLYVYGLIVMAYTYDLYTYCAYSYGLYRYGLCSYHLVAIADVLIVYGLCTYGLCNYRLIINNI